MDDEQILALYWQRDERAIAETAARYGPYCRRIAHNILADEQDAEECLNDTWLRAWGTIPPHRPERLSTFLGKLTRELSLSRLRARLAQKRGGGEAALALEELSECVPGPGDAQQELEAKELARALNAFLATLRQEERDLFVSRYWFLTLLEELGRRSGWSQSRLKSALYRTRKKLYDYLREEGWC